ncbi:50S ribosomal protein L30 [bacterium]|nr:50S ribosomal protein L30 [bacterium]
MVTKRCGMNNKRSGVNIRITLIRGLAGKKERHRRTIKALGLKRIGSSVIKEDNLQIRGMIARVSYMVKVNGVKPVKSTKGK